EVREVLRRLARFEGGGLPVVSVYLDMRPEASGERPGRRPGETVLRERLREIERTYLPRGPQLDSFRADAERVGRYVAQERAAGARRPPAGGAALFAGAGRGLFGAVRAGPPFENQVSAGPAPDLFQLARSLDEAETAVIAVVDSNTARLFVRRAGVLEEAEDV